MSDVTLSLAITYFPNRFEHFKRSINSIYYQKADFEKVELLFLNDGGGKEIDDLLQKYQGRFAIRYFTIIKKTKDYSNSSRRRNFLIRKARGKYILITDPEMVHGSNTLSLAMKAFERHGDDIWYCGKVYGTPFMVNQQGKLPFYVNTRNENIDSLIGEEPSPRCRLDLRFYSNNQHYHALHPDAYASPFWCTALAKANIVKVDALNENLQKYGFEDVDLFERLKNIGVKRVYDTRFISYHLPHPVTLSQREQRFWYTYNQYIPMHKKYSWGYLEGETVVERKLR
jgi:GT2 family glycosyltransferase